MAATTFTRARGRTATPAAPSRPAAAGARAMAPLLVGVAPLGLAIGATVADSGMDPVAGWSSSWLIFSGTPQLLTLSLLEQGATALTIVVTVALVNLRLTVYSAGLAPQWRSAPRRWKALACYLLTDPCYVVAERYAARDPRPEARRAHYLGAALTLWVGWLAACAAGVAIGDVVRQVVPTEVVLDLVLVAMVIPGPAAEVDWTPTTVAAVVALPALWLPMGTGPLVAAAVATAVALRARPRPRVVAP